MKKEIEGEKGTKLRQSSTEAAVVSVPVKDGMRTAEIPWTYAYFEIAERHGLEKDQIIGFDGKLLPIAGEFAGQGIAEARPKIVEKLKAKGLLVNIDTNYVHNLAINDRGKGLIEPQIKLQWFMKGEAITEISSWL